MKELIIIIFITTIGVFPTVLGDLAASMKAGEWKELNTNGLSQEFLETYKNMSNRSILQYAAKAQWEPSSKKFFFLGSGHSNAYKFVVYSDATNSWSTGPLPRSCMNYGHTNGGCDVHSYYNSSLDPVGGRFLYMSGGQVYAYKVSSNSWSTITSQTPRDVLYGGLAYFPETNLFLYTAGWRGTYTSTGGSWTKMNVDLSVITNFAYYNPLHKMTLFGGGDGNSRVWKIDTTRKITQVSNSPAPIRVCSSVLTLDPVTKKYLVAYATGGFYEYDMAADKWSSLSSSVPSEVCSSMKPDGCNWGVAAASVSTYGVNMFLLYNPAKVYIYKHSDASAVDAEGLANRGQGSVIHVQPSPYYGGDLKIRLTGYSSKGTIQIIDMQGRSVQSFDAGKRITWKRAKALTPGVYIVKWMQGSRKIAARRMIVVR
jgi:hypothetical protein